MNSLSIINTSSAAHLVDSLSIPGIAGVIGITSCPGMTDTANFALCREMLCHDLQAIRSWGADVVVTLLETSEFQTLGGRDLGKQVLAFDMVWFHLPLRNKTIPDELSGSKVRSTIRCLCNLLRQGQRVVVHCNENAGRSGLVAVCLLLGLGMAVDEALRAVRAVRPGSLSCHGHEQYCRSLAGAEPLGGAL